ncbi:hypothetical protein PMAYCL1PPCAC_01190 [Pristionchus mayeri]|uniref:Uncharacterized protein n=1 Tax=Pristionchus mayeri TaxID=1317129 RepID=A0AAN5C527_9BILA|nr:hypothetical protein PMAYCL1PPCAC_01190 [Pristionchus mayeri]
MAKVFPSTMIGIKDLPMEFHKFSVDSIKTDMNMDYKKSHPTDGVSTVGAEGVKCDLCGKYTRSYSALPASKILRDDILIRVVPNTKDQQDIIEGLMCNKNNAFFCAEHIEEKQKGDRQNRARHCLLCRKMTYYWLASPFPPSNFLEFFDRLTVTDENQQKWIDFTIKWNQQASICTKHYNGPPMGFVVKKSLPVAEKQKSPVAPKKDKRRRRFVPSEDSDTSVEDEETGPSNRR